MASVNKQILSSINTLLDSSLAKHSKVMTVRFDLRFPKEYSGDVSNKPIRRCLSKINQSLSRKQLDPSYIWVREQATSNHPHFHCAVLVNAHKLDNKQNVFKIAEKLWKSTISSNKSGLVHQCNISSNGMPHQNGIVIRKDHSDYSEKIEDVQRQLSYLAKSADKGCTGDGLRDYGTSRLKNK